MDGYKIKFDLKEKVKEYDNYLLTKYSKSRSDLSLKAYLVENNLKNDICETCKLTAIWNKKILNLVIHRKNNNAKDNRLENLMILCPNCFSQVKKRPNIYVKNKSELFTNCCDCGKKIKYSVKRQKNNKYQTFRCTACLEKAICTV